MWIDKAATFALAQDIGGDALLALVVEDTHSCYLGDRTHRHDWGYGCGECPACELRAKGYATFTSPDERQELEPLSSVEMHKNIEGVVFLVLFCLTIPAANWMIGHVGTACQANGPCLLPVAPGINGAVRRV